MHIVFVNYTYSGECREPGDWLRKIAAHLPLMEALGAEAKVSYVTRIGWTGAIEAGGVQFYFVRRHAGDHYFPVALHQQVRQLMPDKVIVAGMHYPVQVMQLRNRLDKHCRIFVRHHADKPFTGFKRWFQRRADRVIDQYLFTSGGNAAEWLEHGIISDRRKLVELPATAPGFVRMSKATARLKTGVEGSPVFIWAGRLEENKDPLTVVCAFCEFALHHPSAALYMVFQTAELLEQVKAVTEANPHAQVHLVGQVTYSDMPYWLSAADFFVSGSHREGGSYALLEAMACGCVPIVTSIAPALQVTGGKGFSYPPGKAKALQQCMEEAAATNITVHANETEKHFLENYTAEKLALALTAL